MGNVTATRQGRATPPAAPRRPVLAALAALLAALPAAGSPPLVEATAGAGLAFVHFNGMTGDFYFPEMTGQGGALFDYDGDGDLDAYLVQGGMLGPGKSLADALAAPPPGTPLSDRLLRNDLVPGAGGAPAPRFVDVTAASGLAAAGYGMGVATGDYDGDGRVDLYVTNHGANQLWRNLGDGTFHDATREAGVGDPLWGTSAAFVDYDGDGRLDLYVVNYVEFDLVANPRCFAPSTRRDYCGPAAFPPQPDRLYRNLGDGSFTDATLGALPGYRPGPGLGVVTGDLDGDGRVDLYVANDGSPNQLWLNRGDGTFREDALMAGVAVNRHGQPEASMGVDAADFDQDGDLDLFMTHLAAESNTLYVNQGGGLFEDRSVESGLAAASLPYTAFGTGWLDLDNDGLLDLLVVNGAVRIQEELAAAGDPYPLGQPNQLFRNRGGAFSEVTAAAGAALAPVEVSRGLALGDVDNDGATDALVLNNNGPARLLANRGGGAGAWVAVAADPATRLRVARGDGTTLHGRAATDGSYCSARDPRRIFGLGENALGWVEAACPGGPARRWIGPPTGRYLVAPACAGGAPS